MSPIVDRGDAKKRSRGRKVPEQAPEPKIDSRAAGGSANGKTKKRTLSREAASRDAASVREIELPGRRVLTIPPDHVAWVAAVPADVAGLSGAIVRVQPPARATDDQVRRLVEDLREVGAHVRLDPRPRAKAVPAEAVRQAAPRSLREVVLGLCDRAGACVDRAELRAEVEAILDAEGV